MLVILDDQVFTTHHDDEGKAAKDVAKLLGTQADQEVHGRWYIGSERVVFRRSRVEYHETSYLGRSKWND